VFHDFCRRPLFTRSGWRSFRYFRPCRSISADRSTHALDGATHKSAADGGYRHLSIVLEEKIGVVSRADFLGFEVDRLEDETHRWERIG
jgi:hypothetical protein